MSSKEKYLRGAVGVLSLALVPLIVMALMAWGKYQGAFIFAPIIAGIRIWLLVTSEDEMPFASFTVATYALLAVGLVLGTFGAEVAFGVFGPMRVVYAGQILAATMGLLLLVRAFLVRAPMPTTA